jgi:hypothetical protein
MKKEDSNGSPKVIAIPDPVHVGDLAGALEMKWYEVIRELMVLDVFATKDTRLDFTTAAALCSRRGFVARKLI